MNEHRNAIAADSDIDIDDVCAHGHSLLVSDQSVLGVHPVATAVRNHQCAVRAKRIVGARIRRSRLADGKQRYCGSDRRGGEDTAPSLRGPSLALSMHVDPFQPGWSQWCKVDDVYCVPELCPSLRQKLDEGAVKGREGFCECAISKRPRGWHGCSHRPSGRRLGKYRERRRRWPRWPLRRDRRAPRLAVDS